MILRSFMLAACAYSFAIGAKAGEAVPPEPSDVYRTVDKLWKEKQFGLIQQYLDGVRAEWPGYIPAMLAETRRLSLDGGQYPEALIVSAKIMKTIERDPFAVSPGFYDMFHAYSKRQDDAWLSYTSRGIGKEERTRRFKIENNWRPKSSWKQELLFLCAPCASITPDGLKVYDIPIQIDDEIKKLDTKTLRKKTFDLQISDSERYSMAAELARRAEENGMEGMLEAVSHPTVIVVAPYLVDGFWKLAKEMPSEDLLKLITSELSLFDGGMLWIIAQAPPEKRLYAKKLMDEYAKTFLDEDKKKYAKILQTAMERQSGAQKHGKAFDNGGRPVPEEAKLRRGASRQHSADTQISGFEVNAWIIAGAISLAVVVGLMLRKALKNK